MWISYLPYLTLTIFALKHLNVTPQTVPSRAYAIAMGITALLWLMQVQIDAGHLHGMSYHLLGLNLVALMLGLPAAFLLGSAWLLMFGILRHGSDFLSVFALNGMAIILPTCFINALFRYLTQRFLPKQVFIYIFVNAFLASAFGMLATGLVVCSLLHSADVFSGSIVWQAAFPVFFLLTWGEAFLSGIGAAICVAFKPELLQTFDDAIYLKRQNSIWRD